MGPNLQNSHMWSLKWFKIHECHRLYGLIFPLKFSGLFLTSQLIRSNKKNKKMYRIKTGRKKSSWKPEENKYNKLRNSLSFIIQVFLLRCYPFFKKTIHFLPKRKKSLTLNLETSFLFLWPWICPHHQDKHLMLKFSQCQIVIVSFYLAWT